MWLFSTKNSDLKIFTPTRTPAIKNILVSAIKTAYAQKLYIATEASPTICALPKAPINIPYVTNAIIPDILINVNSIIIYIVQQKIIIMVTTRTPLELILFKKYKATNPKISPDKTPPSTYISKRDVISKIALCLSYIITQLVI